MAWTSLCEWDELQEDVGRYAEIDGFHLAVFRHGGQVYVMDNACPHAGASLFEGTIENGCCVCPYHRWAFDLTTGRVPTAQHLSTRVYPTRLLARADRPTLVQADLPMY